jgi:hypothetical protein
MGYYWNSKMNSSLFPPTLFLMDPNIYNRTGKSQDVALNMKVVCYPYTASRDITMSTLLLKSYSFRIIIYSKRIR